MPAHAHPPPHAADPPCHRPASSHRRKDPSHHQTFHVDVIVTHVTHKLVSRIANSSMRNLFLKGLPKDLSEDTLRLLISRYGIVTNLLLLRTAKGLSRGVAMVAMSTEEEARSTVELLKGKCFRHENEQSWITADASSAEESLIVEIAHKEVLSDEEKRLKYETKAMVQMTSLLQHMFDVCVFRRRLKILKNVKLGVNNKEEID
eukprot:713382-Hanusia_phi.AAC.4